MVSPRRFLRQVSFLAIALFGFFCQVAPAQEVTSYDVFKVLFYQQTSALQPTDPVMYTFDARIFLDSSLTSATSLLTTPTAQTYSMGTSGNIFEHREDFATQAELDSTYTTGTYTLALDSTELSPQSQSGNVVLPEPFYSENVPFFTNFDDFATLDPSQPFTFEWNSFQTNGDAPISDLFFLLYDVSASNFLFTQFFSDETFTSFTVAGGSMTLGGQYVASVFFSGRESTLGAGFNEADALAAYDRATDAPFTIVPVAPVPEPGTTAAALLLLGSLIAARLRRRRV